jgi:hypothetical protein
MSGRVTDARPWQKEFVMLGQRFVSVLGIAVIGTAVAVGGCASAADQPPVAGGASATAAGGNVRVTDYSDNDGPKSTVIFVGVVGDYGQATSVHPDGSVDPEHDSQLDVALTQGTFRIGITDLHQKITEGFLGFPANRSTCSGTVTATAAMPIVAGSGTGAYRGIKGSFVVTATIDEVDAKANCSGSSALLSQTIVMTGPGTVSLGR